MSEKTKNNEVSFAQRLSRKSTPRRRTLGITALLALVASCTFWGATDDIDRGDEPPEGKPATTPAIIRGDEKLSDLQALQQILKVSDDQAVELKAFIRQEQAITHRPLYAGNRVELLKDGPETYDAMLSAIGDATDEVHMETFIFADDKVGQIFSEALIDAQRRGVQVRLIYDGLANLDTKEDFFDALETAGIETCKFNPPDPAESLRVWRVNNRNHRKLLLIDTQTAFVGGVNVASVYAASSRSAPGPDKGLKHGWRDTHVRIRGPVAGSFAELFAGNWEECSNGTQLKVDTSGVRLAGPELVRAIASEGGDGGGYEIYQVYLAAIQRAKARLWITHAYFSPNDELLDAIIEAAERGVDVRLLLPGFIDFNMIFYASRSNYDRLLDAGVRIFERNDALLHSKTAVVDGIWATVGSANLDLRSFLHNDEVNATVFGKAFGEQMEALFLDDAAKAQELQLEQWRERPITNKVKEYLAKKFNYWL